MISPNVWNWRRKLWLYGLLMWKTRMFPLRYPVKTQFMKTLHSPAKLEIVCLSHMHIFPMVSPLLVSSTMAHKRTWLPNMSSTHCTLQWTLILIVMHLDGRIMVPPPRSLIHALSHLLLALNLWKKSLVMQPKWTGVVCCLVNLSSMIGRHNFMH